MKRISVMLALASLIAVPQASAEVTEEDFEQLRAQLVAVSQRLEELAAENAALKRSQTQNTAAVQEVRSSVAEVTPAAGSSWTDRIGLDGDFPLRRIDQRFP